MDYYIIKVPKEVTSGKIIFYAKADSWIDNMKDKLKRRDSRVYEQPLVSAINFKRRSIIEGDYTYYIAYFDESYSRVVTDVQVILDETLPCQ